MSNQPPHPPFSLPFPLQPEDEFVMVCCDGIWNSLESQEVVDFVRYRLTLGKPLKQIVEEVRWRDSGDGQLISVVFLSSRRFCRRPLVAGRVHVALALCV